MACKCSPSLVRFMADFAKLGHVNSGCCGDAAHQARKSDHNPDASGYAHAQDVHEKNDHDMQPYVDYVMAHPDKFPQVKFMIYERVIYYPHVSGSRRPGPYAYTGPNAHAAHLHVSIFADFTNYGGSWHVAEAYGTTPPEEDDMTPEQAKDLADVAASVEHFQEFFNGLEPRVIGIEGRVNHFQEFFDTLEPRVVEIQEKVDALVEKLTAKD